MPDEVLQTELSMTPKALWNVKQDCIILTAKNKGHTWKLTTPSTGFSQSCQDGHQMTNGENQPCNKFYSTSGEGGGRQKCLLQTEMLTDAIRDGTDKHQPSLPNSMRHIPSSQANSKKMPHILWNV
jgi:hypothetical protein